MEKILLTIQIFRRLNRICLLIRLDHDPSDYLLEIIDWDRTDIDIFWRKVPVKFESHCRIFAISCESNFSNEKQSIFK